MTNTTTIRALLQSALSAYVQELRQNRVGGILLAGSLSHGEPGPYSDVDLYVLMPANSASFPEWETVTRHGVELEVTRHTAEAYRAIISQGQKVKQVIHPLATGQVLFDALGEMRQLKELAHRRLEALARAGPLEGSERQSALRVLHFMYRKVGNAVNRADDTALDYELGFALHVLPSQVLALMGHRVATDPLALLRTEQPQLFLLWQETAAARNRDQRWACFRELLQAIVTTCRLGDLPQPLATPPHAVD